MRFDRAKIEDQLIATLRENATLDAANVTVRTHVGDVNPAVFLDPSMKTQLEGFVRQMPFIYVQYQGKRKAAADSTKRTVYYNLRWRFYIGTTSLRDKRSAQLSAYDMLDALYDSIHGKIPNATDNASYVVSKLSGDTILTPFTATKPFETPDGEDEKLLVNIPGIVVYQSDFICQVQS